MLDDRIARNIQGISIAGFKKDHQQLLFVRFGDDAARTRRLLEYLAHRTDSAWEVRKFNDLFSELRRRERQPEETVRATWTGTLISASGFRKLGVNLDELPAGPGSDAFRAGMAARVGQIGDTREKDQPGQWIAGFRPDRGGVDALIVIASDDEQHLDHFSAELENHISEFGCEAVFSERGATLPGHLRGREHFGFKDGNSQPLIVDWDPAPRDQEPPAVPIGEFVFGYADAVGEIAAVGDLWRDGSFAVFRRLHQDVAGFRAQAATGVPGADPALAPEQLAAKMVGRWPSGTPTALAPDADSHEPTNAFQYSGDPDGFNTPRFAHIRKANPRDEARVDHDIEPTERHRMLRRGTPYGPPLGARASADDGLDRGLHFISFVGDLDRQFEFVQRKWLNDPNFPTGGQPAAPTDPYTPPPPGTPADGPDPVVGEFDAGAQDTLHQPGGVHPFALMHEVVTVTGGEYFFAPSLQALKRLADGSTASTVEATQTPPA
jgi:Dyp-type peroxidase family